MAASFNKKLRAFAKKHGDALVFVAVNYGTCDPKGGGMEMEICLPREAATEVWSLAEKLYLADLEKRGE